MPLPREKLAQILAMASSGQIARAIATCQTLLRQHPREVGVLHVMADLHMRNSDPVRAAHFIEQAAALAPRDAMVTSAHARILGSNQRHEEVIPVARRLSELAPATGEGEMLEALALTHLGRHASAVACCRRGLARAPDNPQLLVTCATELLQCGESNEAVEMLEKLAARYPNDTLILGNRALTLNYIEGADRTKVFEAHRAYQTMLDRTLVHTFPSPPSPADPEKRLRIGVLSPDLRDHPVGRFMRPIFAHLDRSRFELAAYFTSATQPSAASWFKDRADLWRPCGVGSYQSFAQTIRDDRVDILIELSGHTGGEKLGVMHLRPAPLQCTYLGYPNTTGLQSVDLRLIDSQTDPPGDSEVYATERLERLDPCFLCYEPPESAPPVAERDRGVPLTFGSFNAIQKVGDGLLALWAQVLAHVPESRLLIKAFNLREAELRERVLVRCVKAGLDPDRLSILPPTDDPADHLASYAKVDVALDTHPYCGTTTTCEALWMGVPVVTLAGQTHASRVGASLLGAIGRPDWVAQSHEQYIDIASGLASDRAALAAIRAGQRERMLASALCDGPGYVRRFERALRDAWRRACG